MRRQWYVMAALILIFIIGYFSYAIVFWKRDRDLADLLVPTVFFFGACFVWLVLSHLGELIRNRIRSSDIAARYGGEEFMIVAPNTAALPAATLAERLRLSAVSLAEQLRQQIASQELVVAGGPNTQLEIHITVSIGISEFIRETENVRKLVQCADEALYRAKQEGRNRVVIYNWNTSKTIDP